MASASAPLQPPSPTASGVPVRRVYEVNEPDDFETDEPLEIDVDLHPLDPFAESMARQRVVMGRMRRAQDFALQNQFEDEAAWINSMPRRQLTRGEAEEDNEDEMLRRAIAESEAMAQTMPVPAWSQHRVYESDDDDEEFQAALRASLETAPNGFHVSTPLLGAPSSVHSTETPTRVSPPVSVQAESQVLPLERRPAQPSNRESEVDTAEGSEPEQPSVEDIRKRRLARFDS